jgi:acyl dehydratase
MTRWSDYAVPVPKPPEPVSVALIDATGTRCLGKHDFAHPPGNRYFEDYQPGSVYEYGTITVTEPQILAYARAFDPQLMHVDVGAAEHGPFRGLVASGWHTSAVAMRLFVDHFMTHVASLASPGMETLRWPRPVGPGDELRLRTTILSARASSSRPDRGVINTHLQLFNQHDEETFAVEAVNFIGLRSSGPVIGPSAD